MAFGVGDIEPYTMLPGGVAGQQAPNIVKAASQGGLDAAALESALAKGQVDDINAKMMIDRLPQEIAMKNIQDAQSINTIPPRPGLDDVNQAELDVMGEDHGTREPTAMERHKIQIRSEELARQRMPKFDVRNPMDYLEKVQPASNREMQLEGQGRLYQGRYDIADMNNAEKYRREDYALSVKQSEGDKNRTTRETVAGTYAGAGIAPGGQVPIKTQTRTNAMEQDFLKNNRAGQIISMAPPERAKAEFEQNPQLSDALAKFINNVDRLGDHQKAVGYYKKYKDFLPTDFQPPGTPGRAPQSTGEPKPYNQDDMSSRAPMAPRPPKHREPAPDTSGDHPVSYDGRTTGYVESPNEPTPGGQQEMGSPGGQPHMMNIQRPKVVTINGQAYGVGDPVSIAGRNYIVIEGKGGLGRLKRVD